MKTKLLAFLLLAGSCAFAGPRVVIGVGIGGYVAPAPVVTYAPAPVVVRPGYWAPPYRVWVGPRYYGHTYYRGYWRR